MNHGKKYAAELIGTMILVIFGCGSTVAANTLIGQMGLVAPFGFTTLAIAIAFGLTMIAMSYSIGNISGCHINPAISLGMFISGKMDGKDFACYIIAQFLGAVAGAGILVVIFGSSASLGTNGFDEASALGISLGRAFLLEVILTFVFVMTVIGVKARVENKSIAGIVIGFTLTLVHILGIPFTGTSVNPARSFGPALFAGGQPLGQVWIFIVAPLVGAIVAAFVYKYLSSKPKAIKEELEMNIIYKQ